MSKKYTSIDEITKDFIRQGWNNPTFKELEKNDEYYDVFQPKILKGNKYFVMIETGNVFDDRGKIAMYNIDPLPHAVSIPAYYYGEVKQ